jgi:hypothetical protein
LVSEVFPNEEIELKQMDEEVQRVSFCNKPGGFNSSEVKVRPVLRA